MKEVIPVGRQHTLLVLGTPILAADAETYLDVVYVYTPHLDPGQPKNARANKLAVPYYSQLDNNTLHHEAGSRHSNLASCSMFLEALKPSIKEEIEFKKFTRLTGYYGQKLAKYLDATNQGANTLALKDFGVESYVSYTLSLTDLLACLKAGYPVVLGVAYKDSKHMIVATGFDLDKEHILMHDPYGIRHGGSDNYDIGANGAYDPYSFDVLERIWVLRLDGEGFLPL